MTVYNKLVRDRIPEIIRAKGENPITRIMEEFEFREALQAKLHEEIEEYMESPSLEELADIAEVLRAIASVDGSSWDDVERARQKKAQERGGFTQRICLERV